MNKQGRVLRVKQLLCTAVACALVWSCVPLVALAHEGAPSFASEADTYSEDATSFEPQATVEVGTEDAFRSAVAVANSTVTIARDITIMQEVPVNIADGVTIVGIAGSERISVRNKAINVNGTCTMRNFELIMMPDGSSAVPLTVTKNAKLTLDNMATAYTARVGDSAITVANMSIEIQERAVFTAINSRATTAFNAITMSGYMPSVTLDANARATNPIDASSSANASITFTGLTRTPVQGGKYTKLTLCGQTFDGDFVKGLSDISDIVLDAASLKVPFDSTFHYMSLSEITLSNKATLDLSELPDALLINDFIINGAGNRLLLNSRGQFMVTKSITGESVELMLDAAPRANQQYLVLLPSSGMSHFVLNVPGYTLTSNGQIVPQTTPTPEPTPEPTPTDPTTPTKPENPSKPEQPATPTKPTQPTTPTKPTTPAKPTTPTKPTTQSDNKSNSNSNTKPATPTTPTTPTTTQTQMYRLYNKWNGEHFYTSDTKERNHLISIGWNNEGTGWIAPKSGDPVYRLYNPYAGDHHYTTSATERDACIKAGWNYEGIGWYSDKSKKVPLYREYNPYAITGSHNYTTNKSEHDALIKAGWRNEGYAWYGI